MGIENARWDIIEGKVAALGILVMSHIAASERLTKGAALETISYATEQSASALAQRRIATHMALEDCLDQLRSLFDIPVND